MMHALYRQEGAMLRVEVMAEPEVTDFISTHADALNSSMRQVAMSDAMRQRLERSNFIFSGFKAFHELNEAFPSLIGENGERKPFDTFLNEVHAVDETYNVNYLRAEYNFVNASADMAAKWEQIEADGDRYNLQYRTQHDDKVRPEHAALDGVTLPPSDPFWESYYPPNGCNCRCTVAQVRKTKYPTRQPILQRLMPVARRHCSVTRAASSDSILASRARRFPTTIPTPSGGAGTATSLRARPTWHTFQTTTFVPHAGSYDLAIKPADVKQTQLLGIDFLSAMIVIQLN